MQKIPSLFQRNYEGDRLVRDEVVPGSEWVIEGQGLAFLKRDGTACLIKGGELFKRYDAKQGKTPPPGFIPAQDPDPKTGHWPGWVKVGDGPEDRWHREAFARLPKPLDGRYELIGPKINGNNEEVLDHWLISHVSELQKDVPRTFVELRRWLSDRNMEGIVWHHPDGRMAKIKRKDFGLNWPVTGDFREALKP